MDFTRFSKILERKTKKQLNPRSAMHTRLCTQIHHHLTDMWDPLYLWAYISSTQRERERRCWSSLPVAGNRVGGGGFAGQPVRSMSAAGEGSRWWTRGGG
jgi:hypothetical protein